MSKFWGGISLQTFSFYHVLAIVVITIILTSIVVRFSVIRQSNTLFRKRSRSVVTGLVNEQLAPLLRGFPGMPSEARFIGKPIDYIVFKGLSKGEVEEVVFVEVKSHSGIALSSIERSVRKAIRNHQVSWVEYFPE
ncbi:Holliday junction resolvase [bacterium]|nr:Holliday junction resolvase [candidate division CSSED10-310 bacterium]